LTRGVGCFEYQSATIDSLFGVTDVDSHPGPLTSLFQGISGHENMKTPGAEDKGTGKSVAGPETCMVDVLGCLGKHVFH